MKMERMTLNRQGARGRAHRARLEPDRAERELAVGWRQWRGRIERHRAAVLVGTGLLGGIALETVSPQRWSRVGAALFGTGAWLARSALGPALIGALFTGVLARPNGRDPSTQGS